MKDWHPSQGQQEAQLAEVALVINGSLADEAVVRVDVVLVSSSGSQSRFFVRFSFGSVSSNSSNAPSFL